MKKYINNILLLHDFNSRLETRIVSWQIAKLAEGFIGNKPAQSKIMEMAHGMNSITRTRKRLAGYFDHAPKNDVFLLLMKANRPDAETVIVLTKSGYTFIGPNDGHLGFIMPNDVKEVRKIVKPEFDKDFSRRIHAAANLAKGVAFDEFTELLEPDQLVR